MTTPLDAINDNKAWTVSFADRSAAEAALAAIPEGKCYQWKAPAYYIKIARKNGQLLVEAEWPTPEAYGDDPDSYTGQRFHNSRSAEAVASNAGEAAQLLESALTARLRRSAWKPSL